MVGWLCVKCTYIVSLVFVHIYISKSMSMVHPVIIISWGGEKMYLMNFFGKHDSQAFASFWWEIRPTNTTTNITSYNKQVWRNLNQGVASNDVTMGARRWYKSYSSDGRTTWLSITYTDKVSKTKQNNGPTCPIL